MECACINHPIRTVRMGSRVSVVEKRLDETAEHLLLVGRLRDKSWAHTAQINDLSKAVTELRNLLGVEERFNGAIEATQVHAATFCVYPMLYCVF